MILILDWRDNTILCCRLEHMPRWIAVFQGVPDSGTRMGSGSAGSRGAFPAIRLGEHPDAWEVASRFEVIEELVVLLGSFLCRSRLRATLRLYGTCSWIERCEMRFSKS